MQLDWLLLTPSSHYQLSGSWLSHHNQPALRAYTLCFIETISHELTARPPPARQSCHCPTQVGPCEKQQKLPQSCRCACWGRGTWVLQPAHMHISSLNGSSDVLQQPGSHLELQARSYGIYAKDSKYLHIKFSRVIQSLQCKVVWNGAKSPRIVTNSSFRLHGGKIYKFISTYIS